MRPRQEHATGSREGPNKMVTLPPPLTAITQGERPKGDAMSRAGHVHAQTATWDVTEIETKTRLGVV